MNSTPWKRYGSAAGLLAGGLVAGGILAGTLTANAAEGTTTAQESASSQQSVDPSQPQRPDEELLTGDVKSQVEAAVLAEYPDASIERSETDSDGVYESHIVTSDGEHVIVQVGEDFSVTGTDTGPGGGPDAAPAG